MTRLLVVAETFDRLQQAMAADKDGFCELYRDYLSDAWQTLAELRLAYEGRQPAKFGDKAHYLKSSSLVLGIRPVAQCCAQMEAFGRQSDFPSASGMLEQTAELLSLVQAELETRLGPRVIPSAV